MTREQHLVAPTRDHVPPKRYLGNYPLAIRCRLFGHEWLPVMGSYDATWGTWGYDCGRCGRRVGW